MTIETTISAEIALGQCRSANFASFTSDCIGTLEKGLGAVFTAEVREAWTAVCQLLSGTMQSVCAAA